MKNQGNRMFVKTLTLKYGEAKLKMVPFWSQAESIKVCQLALRHFRYATETEKSTLRKWLSCIEMKVAYLVLL